MTRKTPPAIVRTGSLRELFGPTFLNAYVLRTSPRRLAGKESTSTPQRFLESSNLPIRQFPSLSVFNGAFSHTTSPSRMREFHRSFSTDVGHGRFLPTA